MTYLADKNPNPKIHWGPHYNYSDKVCKYKVHTIVYYIHWYYSIKVKKVTSRLKKGHNLGINWWHFDDTIVSYMQEMVKKTL